MRELESNVYTLIHKPLDDDLTEKIEEAGGRWGRVGGWGGGWGERGGERKKKRLRRCKARL